MRAEWTGCISPTGSAIKAGSPDGGGRVTLDVPETGMDAFAALLAMRGLPLRIVVEVADDVYPPDDVHDRDVDDERGRWTDPAFGGLSPM